MGEGASGVWPGTWTLSCSPCDGQAAADHPVCAARFDLWAGTQGQPEPGHQLCLPVCTEGHAGWRACGRWSWGGGPHLSRQRSASLLVPDTLTGTALSSNTAQRESSFPMWLKSQGLALLKALGLRHHGSKSDNKEHLFRAPKS
jgi:hypothetical protein